MTARHRPLMLWALLIPIVIAVPVVGCGSSKKGSSGSASTLALSISESGKAAKFTVPASTQGGLVTVTLKNEGKMPHSAQFGRVEGKHTTAEALKIVAANQSNNGPSKSPTWLHAEGGVAGVAPGQTGTAIVNLPAGKYFVAELGGGGPPSSGPPAHTDLTVTPGQPGSLPTTPITVTGAAPSKDHYKWDITGALKSGMNRVTFVSKGSSALHAIAAFRVNGNPSKALIIKGLKSNGPPPPFVDQMSFTSTAALDGGKTQVTELALQKPGSYVLFCPLNDRDGGKAHFEEGMLTTVKVK